MIRFKDIHIPKPCSVDYDSLSGDEVKRFCGSCEKHVYDFRGKDEVYLNQTFKDYGKVCGVYYEDQIQKNSLQVNRPFHYAFTTKIVSLLLFIKTFFSTNQAEGSTYVQPVQYQQQDSIAAVKAKLKNKPKRRYSYFISIFINGALYKSNVKVYDGYLFMPDQTASTDIIKVIVHEKKASRYVRGIKQKEYTFKFGEADKILVKVKYKIHFALFKRREIRGKVRFHVKFQD